MAIHDQNYVRYEGPLKEGNAALVIAQSTLRVFLSFLRTKLTILLTWLPALVVLILVFIEYSVRNSQIGQLTKPTEPGIGTLLFFLQVQMFSAALLYMASGCGVIADDLRYRTFQLYFSKPITRAEYGLGKFLGLYALGALATLVPTLPIVMLRVAFFARTDFAGAVAKQMIIAWLLLAVLNGILACIVLGLSSLTSKTGYVILAWIGVILVPIIITIIVGLATKGSDMANLWSLPGNVHLTGRILLDAKKPDVPMLAPFGVLLGLGGAGCAALIRRISKLEGVA